MKIPSDFQLYTDRFILRIPDESDFDFILSTAKYPGFHDGMLWDPPKTVADLEEPLSNVRNNWEEGRAFAFTIFDKLNQERLGRISIRRKGEESVWNVGYFTHPEHQGRGVMSEVLDRLVKFGFEELQATQVIAQYAIWNKSSEKVLLNNGFKFSHHIEKGYFKNGKWEAENEMIISKERLSGEQWSQDRDNFFWKELEDNKYTLFENEKIVVLLDYDPISIGHVIICSRAHYSDFHLLPEDVLIEMTLFAQRYVKCFEKIFGAPGYSLMLNGGAYNDINHCHLHVFPRLSREAFQWTYNDEQVGEDAHRFEVIKKLLEGNF